MAKKKQVVSKRSTLKTKATSPKQSFAPRKLFFAGLLLVLLAFSYQYLKPYIFQSSDVFEITATQRTGTEITSDDKTKLDSMGGSASPVPCTPGKVKSITSSNTCGQYGFTTTTYTCSNGRSGKITTCTEMADLAIQIQKACSVCTATPAPSSGIVRVSPTPRPTVSVTDQLNQCIARCNAQSPVGTGTNSSCAYKCKLMYPTTSSQPTNNEVQYTPKPL